MAILKAGAMLARMPFSGAFKACLATLVGVLIEVPVMLSAVYLVKRSQRWYELGAQR